MQRNCIILGYGRAGKRHKLLAEKHGLRVDTYDPYVQDATYNQIDAVPWFLYDYAVIASPPDAHLEQIQLLVDHNIRVLCEKPLCAMWQRDYITFSDKIPVMLAYNWYYNAAVTYLRGTSKDYNLFAEQSRILPAWGIENDHLPHDLFIIDYISGGIKKIKHANLVKSENHQEIYVEGKTRTGDFNILERVLVNPTERISKVNGVDLVPDPQMFDVMWTEFLAGNYIPSLQDGIKVQELLHDVWLQLESK